jgi:hypothetical protein
MERNERHTEKALYHPAKEVSHHGDKPTPPPSLIIREGRVQTKDAPAVVRPEKK